MSQVPPRSKAPGEVVWVVKIIKEGDAEGRGDFGVRAGAHIMTAVFVDCVLPLPPEEAHLSWTAATSRGDTLSF